MTTSVQTAETTADPNDLDFSTAAEADLLEWMAAAEKCPKDARAAFTEFFRRHVKYFYGQCLKRYPAIADDLVADTFERAYKYAGKFDLKRLAGLEGEKERRRVRSWLGKIGHRLALTMFAKNEKDAVTHPCTTQMPDDWEPEAEDAVSAHTAELIDRVREVVNELPEREREIATVMALSWRPGEKANRWSRADLAAIAEKFDETPENIRKIKSRLISKLGKLLASHLPASVSDR